MATLSKLRIELDVSTTGFAAGIKKAEVGLAKFRTKVVSAATATRSLTTALAGIAGTGFVAKKIFELGSAVEETGSKFNTVFGESTKDVQAFIDNFATMAGLSNEAAQGVLATTGQIAQGMGIAQEASAQFATEIVKVAGDLSSFNNIPIAETSLAIQSALTGERESLKRLGIVINEADVQQQAFANSGKTVAATLTQQEKATATLQLITTRAGVAIGDLTRTQDSAANQARATAAEMKNIADTISVALTPVISFVITKFGEFIKGIQIMATETAVIVARLKVLKEGFFGTAESEEAAALELFRMMVAADEAKASIVGLTNTVQTFGNVVAETQTSTAAFVVDMSGLSEATLHLGNNLDSVAVKVDNNLRPSLRTATTTMEELKDAGLDFASGFANAVIESTDSGIEAFKKFADAVIRELLRIELQNAFISFLGGLGGGGGGAIAGNSTTAGVFNPMALPGVSGGGGGGGKSITVGGTAPIVNQVISFNLSAVDGRDMARALQENAGEIQGIVAQGARQSTAYGRQLRGGR